MIESNFNKNISKQSRNHIWKVNFVSFTQMHNKLGFKVKVYHLFDKLPCINSKNK